MPQVAVRERERRPRFSISHLQSVLHPVLSHPIRVYSPDSAAEYEVRYCGNEQEGARKRESQLGELQRICTRYNIQFNTDLWRALGFGSEA